MGSFAQLDTLEVIQRQIVLPEVHGFYPQGYFPSPPPDEMQAIPTAWDERELSQEEKDAIAEEISLQAYPNLHRLRRLRSYRAIRNKARALRNKALHKTTKPRAAPRYHLLPNPAFTLRLLPGVQPPQKIGVTWMTRADNKKWTLVRKGLYNRFLTALARQGFVQMDQSSFAHPSFSNPIALVELFNFVDPRDGLPDHRFLWVQTTFNPARLNPASLFQPRQTS